MTLELNQSRPDYYRLQDYFGIWSMDESAFGHLFALITEMNLRDHVNQRTIVSSVQISEEKIKSLKDQEVAASASDAPYSVTNGGIAVIHMSGTLMKVQSSLSSSSSTVDIRRAMRAAARDPEVNGVVLVIDSPGGTVAGTADLAADWKAVGDAKPTASYAEDLCASAAYWVGSQGGFFACNPTALVGSIGTFMTVMDTSGRADDMKVKVHVIKAGDHKGAGTPGTKITDEHLATWQEMVNSLNAEFVSGVASGRKMTAEQAATLADGRVHVGEQAKALGLVDAVQSLDETIRQLQERAGKQTGSLPKKGTKMTESTTATTPTAASPEELKAHLVGADDSFIMKQLMAKATLDQAKSNWLAEMNTRLTASTTENAALKAAGGGKAPGVNPLGGGKVGGKAQEESTGNAIEMFDEAVSTLMQHGMKRDQAVAAAARKNPQLHLQFLAATNPGRKSSRLLAEKYTGGGDE